MATANNGEYTPATPLTVDLGNEQASTSEYSPLGHLSDRDSAHKAVFKMPLLQRGEPIPATAQALSEIFLPDMLVDSIVLSTNAYSRKRLPAAKFIHVERADVLRFFAIYYYIGLVELPSKEDYWQTDTAIWPQHQVCQSMTRSMYLYIWRNIHLTAKNDEAIEVEIDDEEEDDESTDSIIPPVKRKQNTDDTTSVEERWFEKAAGFIEHVNKTSCMLCTCPGKFLSIDEMMKLFKGRSIQTHRMKKKPIKEGFKFFAMCDSGTGYVYAFHPDGRKEKGTIMGNVMSLADTLPERHIKDYVVAMDNYFTTSAVIVGLRERNIGVVGTARARRGWPPQEIFNVKED